MGEDPECPWAGPYTRQTCKLLPSSAKVEYLGGLMGPGAVEMEDFRLAEARASKLRSALGALEHPTCESVLLRQCGDICKVTYALRLGGDALDADALQAHDSGLRGALEACLDGPLSEHSWRQAQLGVRAGGLGFRTAERCALAASVASLAAAVPFAEEADEAYAGASIVPRGCIGDAVLQRYRAALDRLCEPHPDEVSDQLRQVAAAGLDFMRERWICVRAGCRSLA